MIDMPAGSEAPKTPIGIIGALDEEIALLLKKLVIGEEKVHAGIRFYVGRIHTRDIVLCKSGIGKVNASLAAQILIDRFNVGCVLFTGTAGAIRRGIDIGDIVISKAVQQYDVDYSAIGYPPGTIPFLKTSIFKADGRLVSLAWKGTEDAGQKAFKGLILTGDRFVASEELAEYLAEEFGGLCVEAEGGAVGQVCYLNRVPFVVVRGMSDTADTSAGETFASFVERAGRNAQKVILSMLSLWDTIPDLDCS